MLNERTHDTDEPTKRVNRQILINRGRLDNHEIEQEGSSNPHERTREREKGEEGLRVRPARKRAEGKKDRIAKAREGVERTSRNKTVISRHFTHEQERLADSTCVPVFATATHGETILSLSILYSMVCCFIPSSSLSISLPLRVVRLFLSHSGMPLSPTPSVRSSLKNTALADTCSFDVLHMCVRTPTERPSRKRGAKKIIAQENFHKTIDRAPV